MSTLGSIPVSVAGSCASAPHTAHNAVPLLHEIRHALEQLAETGETTTIDLSSIPFGPGDRDQLFDVLGQGEVSATIALCALGDTEIRETRYPAVWLVRHLDAEGKEMAMQIEITRTPSLLVTPEQDVADSAAALATELDGDASESTSDNFKHWQE